MSEGTVWSAAGSGKSRGCGTDSVEGQGRPHRGGDAWQERGHWTPSYTMWLQRRSVLALEKAESGEMDKGHLIGP